MSNLAGLLPEKIDQFAISFNLDKNLLASLQSKLISNMFFIITFLLSIISVLCFVYYYQNGLGISYNDARSHLDIGRRVVEGLKPGVAQLGSVWLPLPHALMIPTIWNDFMWHSGLSGALVSMISFVATGALIYLFLQNLGVGILGRLVGVSVFVFNINILYLQSTAMTELLLLATMTASVYELLLWYKSNKIVYLIRCAFFVMLSTLVRYDGWFLFLMISGLIGLKSIAPVISSKRKALFSVAIKSYKKAEGNLFLYATLAGFGIFLWFLWNLLIFKDPLYFAFGPYSARAQQTQLEAAGELLTKGNLLLSTKIYLYAMAYSSNTFITILGFIGGLVLWLDKKSTIAVKIASTALFAPLIFNILALMLGHSVLFIQGISGNTWFNVRYGVMMMPSIAILVGFLVHRLTTLKYALVGLIVFVTFFTFSGKDAVSIDDATVGSSQKNVTEVSGWLKNNAKNQDGFVLISAASHDAIIFSSTLPMKKYIHEGTGKYWDAATTNPDRWARWIIMRTYDSNDSTYKLVSQTNALEKYVLVEKYPFADIYQLKDEYLGSLNTRPSLGKQK